MADKKKERVELQFNMENRSEKELIDFIDHNGTTRAGFIKMVIRQYMNTIQLLGQQNRMFPPKEENPASKESQKKKIPKLGQSFSSKDLH